MAGFIHFFIEIRFWRAWSQTFGDRGIMDGKPRISAGSILRGQEFIHPCIAKSMDFVKIDSDKTAEKEAAVWRTGQGSL